MLGITRREYVKTIGASVGVATAAGCLGSSSGNSITLNMGTWGGSWEKNVRETVIEPFTEETGIEVNSVAGGGGDRFSQIVAQQDGSPPVDVSLHAGSKLVQGSNSDLWLSLESDLVPTLSDIPDMFKGEDWVARVYTAGALLYNTEEVSSAPSSWEALFDSEYQGDISLDTEFPNHDLMTLSLLNTGGESYQEIDSAFELYSELIEDQDPNYVSTTDEFGNLLANESILIGRYWAARAAFWNNEDGTPVTATVPEEGAMTTMFGPGIPKNISDEKREAAGQLVEQMLSTESGRAFAEQVYYTSPNPNVEYPNNVREQIITPEDLDRLETPDYSWLTENQGEWRERANEIVNTQS